MGLSLGHEKREKYVEGIVDIVKSLCLLDHCSCSACPSIGDMKGMISLPLAPLAEERTTHEHERAQQHVCRRTHRLPHSLTHSLTRSLPPSHPPSNTREGGKRERR